MKRNEDARTAALREIREETGLAVRDLRLRGVVNIPADAGNGVLLFVFTAKARSRAIRSSVEGHPEWIGVAEVWQIDLLEDLPIRLPRVLSMGPDDAPVFALYTYNEDDGLTVAGASTTA